ncbi:CHAP domain-containing protein [Alloscardovia venturai]|uniref:CHAP domain-containing protein n=1 Tax=Alloscardovia venturai TaxID=1769421 RepID=A0ABW2Y5D7_9BIFI
MRVTHKRVSKKVQATIAFGLVTLSIISASVVSWYVTPVDSAYAVGVYDNLAQHKQAQAKLQSQLSGVSKQLSDLVLSLNDLVNNQIPAAETAAQNAQNAASAAQAKAQAAAQRLTAAQNDKATLENQIANNKADYDAATASVAAVARNSFHSSNASKTMSIVTGSKDSSDFIASMQSDAAVSRVEARAANDSATALSTGKNRADRLAAIETQIANLKSQADAESEAAQQASAQATQKVSSLNDLRTQADEKSKQLSAQQDQLKTQSAQEAVAIIQAQQQVDAYNKQIAAQQAAARAAAAARRSTTTSQYAARSTSVSASQPAASSYAARSSGDYSVPGNCGATATYCYGHQTGRTSVLGGAYPWSQCTWYAYNRRTALGLPVGSYMGNGKDWANTGRRLGYVVNNTPHVGAAIVFQPGQAGADWTYGHVAVVERVNSDGSVLISECGAVYRGVAHTRIIRNARAYQYVHI